MAAGAYQGDLLELQSAAFARWKVDFEHQTALRQVRDAERRKEEKSPAITIDPLLFIKNLAYIKQLEKFKVSPAFPREYKGELLELQRQIFDRWKESVEYRRLLRVSKRKKKPRLGIGRELNWWEWIPISHEYQERGNMQVVFGPGKGPGDTGFRSVEYKSESSKHRSQRWNNQNREPYKSLEYKLELTSGAKIASSHIDWNSRPVEFS